MERCLRFAVPAPLGVESLVSYELKKLWPM